VGVVIRPWQKADLASVRKITWQSWIHTYSSFIPEGDLKSYFDIHYTEEIFLRLFDDYDTQGFVAEIGHQIAGYARLFFNRDENRLYVPSLYFLPGFQGQGMGGRLLEAAEKYASEKGLDELWIGVMVKNHQALIFYRKMGFQFVKEEPFTMGKTTVSHLIGYKKSGRTSLLIQKTYVSFEGGRPASMSPLRRSVSEVSRRRGRRLINLSRLCLKLLSEQKKTWQLLQQGYELIKNIRERDIQCKGFSVRLQQNPGRIRSSLANVGGIDANERRCFLCLEHLPEGQRGILYREDYLILCNPMPVFSHHFTISHLDHRRQAIAEHIDAFLRLMVDFGSRWTILYNGPKCGASAPDHLHFQAIPSGRMPIEKEIQEKKRIILMREGDGVSFYRVADVGREVIVLEGNDPMAVGEIFKSFLNGLGKVLLVNEEPMINIAGFHKKRKYCIVIFPRRKHRPNAFFK
jgi:ribosomal protein S18 acetylase RimI-like enzyme